MSTGAVNITDEFYEKPYAAYHENSPPAPWFRAKLPTYSGPTLIVFPGTLNMTERAQVNAWLVADAGMRPTILLRCTSRAAIAKITEYIAYYADASYMAWKDACEAATIAQWRLFLAVALVNNKATVSVSADTAGTGSAPATVPFDPATNLT